jgi:hypothetical protein
VLPVGGRKRRIWASRARAAGGQPRAGVHAPVRIGGSEQRRTHRGRASPSALGARLRAERPGPPSGRRAARRFRARAPGASTSSASGDSTRFARSVACSRARPGKNGSREQRPARRLQRRHEAPHSPSTALSDGKRICHPARGLSARTHR